MCKPTSIVPPHPPHPLLTPPLALRTTPTCLRSSLHSTRKSIRQRHVHFGAFVLQQEASKQHILDTKQKTALWYSQNDLSEQRKTCKRLLQGKKLKAEEKEDEHCLRGLQKDGPGKRGYNYEAGVLHVWRSQSLSSSGGGGGSRSKRREIDLRSLCGKLQQHNRETALQGFVRAANDTAEAFRIYRSSPQLDQNKVEQIFLEQRASQRANYASLQKDMMNGDMVISKPCRGVNCKTVAHHNALYKLLRLYNK